MGNDGGSIPDRRDLVRNKPKVRALRLYAVVLSIDVIYRQSRPIRLTKLAPDGSSALSLKYVDAYKYFSLLLTSVQRRLQEPVVACALGKLYNKDSIIEYLLAKSAYGDGEEICGHIRSLKVRWLCSRCKDWS